MIIAETDRLVVTTFSLADLDEIAPIMADPDVMRFTVGGPWDRERTQQFLRKCIENYSHEGWRFGLWALVHKADGRLVGYCGLSRLGNIDGAPEVELSYRLSRDHWGGGLATEAASKVRDYAFEHIGLTRLISMIEPDNIASIRIAEKIGMRREKEIENRERRMLVYSTTHDSGSRWPDLER